MADSLGRRLLGRLGGGRPGLHHVRHARKGSSRSRSTSPSGKTLWKARFGELFKKSDGDGPRATPAVDDGRVYALGGKGTLVCLDAASGKPVWQLNLLEKFGGEPPEYGFSASPLVARQAAGGGRRRGPRQIARGAR